MFARLYVCVCVAICATASRSGYSLAYTRAHDIEFLRRLGFALPTEMQDLK